ncbi:CCA tRNA nucleotidyltransferase 1, mitochondrial-like [Oppia nitens]|uniref:CCA tRNA nucleotidyltransferase 1, mitochondrial-like n=1 Tax=Oppia nitens TaxID=1686743 RepID=UPI0023DB0482|nr:CCA tRNA nucleotidyltransferase 1, mitochondrial-like [Oppia nitens]XP_054153048.1 CCA tRNA nucleotidyltransferase 1, mitochondrial-like [Oppia nitens]
MKILKTFIRSFTKIATIQLKTSLKAKLVEKMLSQNKEAYNIFQEIVKIPEINILDNIFKSNRYELRMAGGAVRDVLCGIQPNDIDFASNATPQQMINIMKNIENVRLITTPAGERHGTVTARINDRHQFEITTLRIDKFTDGRHAEVEFVNDWKIDASRRDLTINSMFLSIDGVLYDYFNGETDLKNKTIRFVGDSGARIREDYLRIFRYFRFHARFGLAANHDLPTLETIRNNCDGLDIISGERIWSEIKRILIIRNCFHVIDCMFNEIHITRYLGFNTNDNYNNLNEFMNNLRTNNKKAFDLTEFEKVLKNLSNGVDSGLMNSWEAPTLFASLFKDSDELINVAKRLKLSNVEKETILYIIVNRQTIINHSIHELKQQLALTPKPNQTSLRKAIIECLKYCGLYSQIPQISEWTIPEFPFTGHLIAGRVKKRQFIKDIINELKIFWAKNEFKSNENDLKEELEKILQNERFKT